MGSKRGDRVIEAVALGLAVGYLALLGLKFCGTLLTIRAASAQSPAVAPGAVAILTPILSGDPDLRDVLDDNVRALVGVHFLWLVDDDDAEGQRIAGAVRNSHPNRAIDIVVCPRAPAGVNPKTFKLELALGRVCAPLFLVLDDDARLSGASLALMVTELAVADLVTGLPSYRDTGPLPGRLLAQFVNNNAALTYLALLPWRRPVSVNGMCYMMRTDWFATLGGFGPLSRHLADDLAVAMRLIEIGARIHQSTAGVEVHTSVPTLRRYVQQMHRWFLFASLLMRVQSPATNVLITLVYGVHPLLLAGLLACAALSPGRMVLGAVALTLLVRALSLAWIQRRLTGRARHQLLLSLASELLQPLHLIHALAVRRVQWRSRRYLVRSNDDFVPL
jgi:ceramide glucosyltransferase